MNSGKRHLTKEEKRTREEHQENFQDHITTNKMHENTHFLLQISPYPTNHAY